MIWKYKYKWRCYSCGKTQEKNGIFENKDIKKKDIWLYQVQSRWCEFCECIEKWINISAVFDWIKYADYWREITKKQRKETVFSYEQKEILRLRELKKMWEYNNEEALCIKEHLRSKKIIKEINYE